MLDPRRDTHRAGTRLRAGRALVVAQVAVSVVLLIGGGLLLRTLRNLTAGGPEAPDVIAFKVHAPPVEATAELSRRLLERLAALPGVRAASASAHHPLDGTTDRTRVAIAGRPIPPGVSAHAHVQRVGGEFFRVNGIAMRAGRALAPRDDAGSARVLVVNEAFARAYFPDGGALGAVVNGATVVGVAPDARALRGPAPPEMVVPASQYGLAVFAFQLDAPGTTSASLEAAVREVAPSAAVYERTTPRAQWAAAAQQERFLASLTTSFAAVALLQAALGLYGSLAQATARRTREIGIRMALGARPAAVRRATVASGLRLAAAGAVLGLAGSAALAPVARTVLYGVTPSDPWTVAATVCVLGAAALAACWLPAARASRVDPAVALRHDSTAQLLAPQRDRRLRPWSPRRAGTNAAARQATRRSVGATAYVAGSNVTTSTNTASSMRPSPSPSAQPAAMPASVTCRPSPTTIPSTRPREAPSAMRTPISRVRRDTAYDVAP